MEVKGSIGELNGTVKSLNSSVEKLASKVDKMEDKLSGVTHKIYAAGVVLAIALVVGGFIVNKAWDLMATQIARQTVIQAPVATPVPSAPPTPR